MNDLYKVFVFITLLGATDLRSNIENKDFLEIVVHDDLEIFPLLDLQECNFCNEITELPLEEQDLGQELFDDQQYVAEILSQNQQEQKNNIVDAEHQEERLLVVEELPVQISLIPQHDKEEDLVPVPHELINSVKKTMRQKKKLQALEKKQKRKSYEKRSKNKA